MPRADDKTLHLPFAIPAKEWFGPAEAGRVLGLSERTVENLYEKGHLSGHRHNAAAGKRDTKRIPRTWIIAYMVRTADYDDAALLEAFAACAPRLSPAVCLHLADAFRKAAGR